MATQLTKTTKDGTPLYRRPTVEAAINVALQQPLETITARLSIVRQSDPNFLESECVVHLLRSAFDSGDNAAQGVLFTALARRVEQTALRHVRPQDLYKQKQLVEDVISKLGEVLAGGTADLDYYEVSFNRQLRWLYLPILIPKSTFYEESLESHEDTVDPRPSKYDATNHKIDLRQALLSLTPNELRAYTYIEEMKYQASSKDESKTTAATLCGVSDRTIRTWQTQYKAKLAKKLGERYS